MKYLVLTMLLLVGCGEQKTIYQMAVESELVSLQEQIIHLNTKNEKLIQSLNQLTFMQQECRLIANRFFPDATNVYVDIDNARDLNPHCHIGEHTGTPSELLQRVISKDVDETLERLRKE